MEAADLVRDVGVCGGRALVVVVIVGVLVVGRDGPF